jgi:hypothetical protein
VCALLDMAMTVIAGQSTAHLGSTDHMIINGRDVAFNTTTDEVHFLIVFGLMVVSVLLVHEFETHCYDID